ncbi:hypothetical protein J7643_12025 [bacterium]|nr:hypothetical protein [bacterium]
MKRAFGRTLSLLLSAASLALAASGAWAASEGQGLVILDKEVGDVTGDGMPDTVLLKGKKAGERFRTDLTVFVEDGAKRTMYRASVGKMNAGYDPELDLEDLDGRTGQEILVSFNPSGTSAVEIYSLFTFDRKLKPVIPQEALNRPVEVKVTFKPNFQVVVEAKGLSKVFDRSKEKQEYISSGLYWPDGTLKRRMDVGYGADGITDLDVVGRDRIKTVQSVSGASRADKIAILEAEWRVENGQRKFLKARILPREEH